MCAEGCKGVRLQVSFENLENLEKPGIACVNIFLNVWVKMGMSHVCQLLFKMFVNMCVNMSVNMCVYICKHNCEQV